MNFLYPLAFMGLISIPAIIAMYLLKQNYREIKSASNILWERRYQGPFLKSHGKS